MSPLPDVSVALWGLTDPVTVRGIVKTIQDGQVVENIGKSGLKERVIEAVLQPMPARQLAMKPEGERTWKWWTIWTTETLELDDYVTDGDGRNFRVKSEADWSAGGYAQYDLVQDFTRTVS